VAKQTVVLGQLIPVSPAGATVTWLVQVTPPSKLVMVLPEWNAPTQGVVVGQLTSTGSDAMYCAIVLHVVPPSTVRTMKEKGDDPPQEPSATQTEVVGQLSRFTTQPVVSEQL